RSLPPEDLVFGRKDSLAIQAANCLIDQAQSVIIATPVYKDAYSGVLKAFLDLLSQDALQGKAVLPIATGESPDHLFAVDCALKPVLAALGACHILRGVYIVDSQIRLEHGGLLYLDQDAELCLRIAMADLIANTRGRTLLEVASAA